MSKAQMKSPEPAGEWVRSVPTLRERHFSQSLERGLAILSCFTPRSPVLGIADVAEELGMSRSTTHRYMLTLTALGYLEQGAKRKYQLALRVTSLGMSALSGTSLREHARPFLEALHRETGYTIAVAVLDGPEILYVDRLPGLRRASQLIGLNLEPGSRAPAHCTAMGKLLLASLRGVEQHELIAELELEARGPNTIMTKVALRAELLQIGEEGMAVTDEELAPGVCAIAAPLRCALRETVAAVGMAASSSVISRDDLVTGLGPHLISTADRISARLGYRRHDEVRRGWE
jgi:IclR family pca regulon transcriptional regulator